MGYLGVLLVLFDVGSPKMCETDADCFDSDFGGWCNPETMSCSRCTQDEQCQLEGAVCNDGDCVLPCTEAMDCEQSVPLCDPDAGHCVGCLDNDDCPADQHCTRERCIDDICTPGELGCRSGDVAVCDEAGALWSVVQICVEGTSCSDEAGEPMCVEDDGGGPGTTGGGTGDTTDDVADPTLVTDYTPIDEPEADDEGCGCSLTPSPASWGVGALLLLLVRTRRARPRRPT